MGRADDVIAVNRFGLGARPGELATTRSDPRGWLEGQIQAERPVPEEIRQVPGAAAVFALQAAARRERRMAQQDAANPQAPVVQNIRKVIAPVFLEQAAARYRIAATSTEPFRERLIHFWTNHFAVSADKIVVAALAATLENEAIRPNVHKSFFDLLLAVEMHPAMILYLDNQASIGPNSNVARMAAQAARQDRKFGINENLGREILELHTLGVDGGYTQADVTSFAQVLTGWSIGGGPGRLNSGKPGEFLFREQLHEPGAKTLLGKRYVEDGFLQGKTVLLDLARHPATARHIATKLVRHFIADEPPTAAVERVAKVFRDSRGDLPSVHRAVLELAQAWEAPQSKFKTPHEYVVSTFRALDLVPAKSQQVVAPLELLGQRPYTPRSPAGWPDTASQWDGPDALLKRIEWATQVGQRMAGRISPLDLAQRSLGSVLSDHSRGAIASAADAAQGLTLFLVSPEFMRR